MLRILKSLGAEFWTMIADSESVGPMVCFPVAPKLIASLLKAVFVFTFFRKLPLISSS